MAGQLATNVFGLATSSAKSVLRILLFFQRVRVEQVVLYIFCSVVEHLTFIIIGIILICSPNPGLAYSGQNNTDVGRWFIFEHQEMIDQMCDRCFVNS